ncbi:hypothetical protein [Nonomuraea typhae]|uniref:Uncharacterized protein n=1 Tax=Nonomuraea typhae TaxID=2603600 RepID=A0ABW7ZAF8_9ACTN
MNDQPETERTIKEQEWLDSRDVQLGYSPSDDEPPPETPPAGRASYAPANPPAAGDGD